MALGITEEHEELRLAVRRFAETEMAPLVDVAEETSVLARTQVIAQAGAAILAQAPDAKVFARTVARLPNTSCIAMPGVSAESQLMAFDLAGVMVSSGSACSSGKVAKSHVLAAMGVADDAAETAIRVSLGWTTLESDIDRFVAAWTQLYRRTHADVRKVA